MITKQLELASMRHAVAKQLSAPVTFDAPMKVAQIGGPVRLFLEGADDPISKHSNPRVDSTTSFGGDLTRPLRRLRILLEVTLVVGAGLMWGIPSMALLGLFLVLTACEVFFLWLFLRGAENVTIRDWH